MLDHKAREFKLHKSVSLEDLVPGDNFYRQVERSIDLSFVPELAAEFYSNLGCTLIDLVVFFKFQLIAFFEGIRSERQLMETVNLNLAYLYSGSLRSSIQPNIKMASGLLILFTLTLLVVITAWHQYRST